MKKIYATLNTSTPVLRAFLFLLLMGAAAAVSAQQIAFPGAEGAGKFTSGGRGTPAVPTTVFEVTNLSDDGQPGSLRYALTAPATYRTVVFRVSGTIRLSSRLNIRANTTIAGQTAPGDGICLADHPVVINGDNIIVRYMRFRMGDRFQNGGLVDGSGGDDTFGGTGKKNIIIDHCSVSWSSDETMTIYNGDSTTLQWNIISEPLNYSYHYESPGPDFQEHGYGGIWGGRKASFHHNLIAHVKGRAPRFSGSGGLGSGTGLENADFRNNVIYNWISYSTNGGEGGNYNIVNNYYKYGPSTATGNSSGVPIRHEIMNPSNSSTLPYPKIYLSGNYVDGAPAISASNWKGMAFAGGSLADSAQSKVTAPFDLPAIPVQSAEEAYEAVLQYAGCNLPARDTLDARIVADVRNRTGRVIDVQGGFPHGTPYAQSATAWPVLQSLPAPADTDKDGMPDAWEAANGLNPADAADRNGYRPDGYTHLEAYLNSLTTMPSITATATLGSFSQSLPAPSAIQNYTVSATHVTDALTITPPAAYQVSADGGLTWHGAATPLELPQANNAVTPRTISVRLQAATAGTHAGNIQHTTTGATPVTVAVTGQAFGSTPPAGTQVIVAPDGSGHFTSVQAAINAAPAGLTSPYIIFIRNGKYREKITIPSNKPFIHLVGESAAHTVLYFDDGASDPLPAGGTVGTLGSASFTVNATDFAAFNITFANTYGDGTQGVAVAVNADRAVFKNCRFLGNQDTLYARGNGTPRQYFRNCYIDGNIDFIFGNAVAVFDSTVVYAKARTAAGNSFITAANTPAGQAYGYVFRDAILPDGGGSTGYFLARPWQNSTGSSPVANNKTVFLNSIMSRPIRSEGWTTWDAGTNTALIYFGEHASRKFDGSPVDVSARVPWSFQLSAAEAATYTLPNIFGSWDPCAVAASVCTPEDREIAVANFRGTKGAASSTLQWNISWAKTGIRYEVYRSASRQSGYARIGEVVAANDSAYNFSLSDHLPAAGSALYYYVIASKQGYASHVSDTLELSSIPTITTTGTLNTFLQNFGTPSGPQTFTVAGTNLTHDISIVAPAGFEISSNGGSTWVAAGQSLVLSPVDNAVAATTISVRLNNSALGAASGHILLTSTGATAVQVAVNGTTEIIPPSTSGPIQEWLMATDNSDNPAVRSAGVTPSTPTFNKLFVSNGTTVTAVPAYSVARGQAFGATANGDGSWGTAAGGPGGNLNRTFYEQFTVTASAGYSVRVDSLLLSAAFYNTSSNTRLAVVYSRSGFVSDSADVSTSPGGFAAPISLPNQTGGPTTNYALAFNDINGITLNPGQTLTFRLYFSCGSTSNGRYAMVKNLRVIGKATDLSAPVPQLSVTGTVSAFQQTLGLPSATQGYSLQGSSLIGDVILVPPAPFEISADGGVTWFNSSTPMVLPQAGGNLSANILIRLNGTAAGSYGGNLVHITSGAANMNMALTGTTAATPLIVTQGSLAAFSQLAGVPSPEQTYSVRAYNLGGSLTITPPAGYEVSVDGGTTWATATAPLVLPATGGSIAATAISVRLNAAAAGAYGGNIVHASPGATDVMLPVNGTVTTSPQVVLVGGLTPFSQTVGAPSAVQTYTVTGGSLSGDITITPPPAYEISLDGGSTWQSAAVILPVSGAAVNATVSVRLNAPAPGTYNGNIAHSSTGAATQSLAVEGLTVAAPVVNITSALAHFTQTIGAPSVAQTYTVSGANLTGDLTIAAPAAFQVSKDGTTWSSSISMTPAGGSITNATVQVRLNAATAGIYGGNLQHTAPGITAISLALTGTAVPPPSITATGTLAAFGQTIGAPSAVQTYSITGNDLTASITVTPPAGYEISADGTNWFMSASPLTLGPTNGAVASTVSVRLNASAAGTYNGNIVHASSGATAVNVALTGTAVLPPSLTASGNLDEFLQLLGTPSASQTVTVNGASLTGNVTITPAAPYEISFNGNSWQTGALTFTPQSGSLNAVTVHVRLNARFTGTYDRVLTIANPGLAPVTVSLKGQTTVSESFMLYPNPVARKLYIVHPKSDVAATITLYNAGGQKLAQFAGNVAAYETKMDVSQMRAGLYFLEYRIGDTKTVMKFIRR